MALRGHKNTKKEGARNKQQQNQINTTQQHAAHFASPLATACQPTDLLLLFSFVASGNTLSPL